MSVTSWFLVSSSGSRHRLPREMIFVGREDCELMLQSRSVDKQHAVINYDASADEHLVKDLGSLNGTFVNDLRIPDQTYITLKLSDVIRFGYDSHIYILERSQHKVPEEALKHERYTSQLQLSQETPGTKKHVQTDERRPNSDKSEQKIITDPSVSRPTPLYGQPSWWGEDDEDEAQRCDPSVHEHLTENHTDCTKRELSVSPDELQDKHGFSYHKEPSYFEIPTKEIHSKPKTASQEVQEIPTKDTEHKPPAKPSVVQGHASFTIEFDEQTPGKMKIKDHFTKPSIRQSRKPIKESIAKLPEVMSVENKVADWLFQSDATMMRSLEEQSGSDELLNKTFKDAHHLEVLDFEESEKTQMVQSVSNSVSQKIDQHLDGEDYPNNYTPDSKSQGKPDPQQAFVIEIFGDTQRKKRSQSFTNNMCSPDFQSSLKSKLDKRKNGERSSNNPPTQQFTIPLKGSDGPQRAGSLRREKTEIRMSTSDFSSRSASKTFGSVGRRSKLSQDFAAELLRVSKPSPAPTWDKNSTWMKTPSSNVGPSVTNQSFPATSHTVNQSIRSPSAPMEDNNTEAKTLVTKQQEEEDSLSDAGTYTIEAESQDKEVVEARSLIDQVFGVGDNSQTSTVKPIVADTEGHDSLLLSENSLGPKLGLYSTDLGDTAKGPVQMQSTTTLTPKGTRWISHWASLADTYSDSGPASGLFDMPTQVDLSTGAVEKNIHQVMLNRRSDYSESGQSSRSRRVLPQVPSKEKIQTPTIHIQPDTYLSGVEKSLQDLKQKWDPRKLSVQDDLDPDSLSDASKSDDGSVVEQCRTTPDSTQKTWNRSMKTSPEEAKDQDSPIKFSTATLTRQQGNLSKSYCSPPNIDQSVDSLGGDNSVSIVRQESYTTERASDNIHMSRLPQISSQPSKDAFKGVSNQETHSYLKNNEHVLASLEAKLLEQHQHQDKNGLEESLSGESDTSSTISGKNASVSVPRKPVVLKGLLIGFRKHKTFDDPSSEKSQSGIKDSDGKVDPGKNRFLLRRNLSSQDFGADVQSPTTQHLPDAVSDQESSSLPSKKYTIPLQKEGTSKSKVHTALARSSSLSAPKPTRASMLRRARLGEASDNESTETDRTSQNSDVNPSANSRGTQESKKLSRLDMLALPRKRTSSFNTPSDAESSKSRTGFSNRSTESSNTVRKASLLDPKALLRKVSNAMNRQPIIRGRSSSAKYASSSDSSRRHQKGSDYASTSEDDYESNHSTPKHKRSHHSGSQQNPRIQPAGPMRAMPCSKDSEGEGHESDAFQNWTSHSAEIARLSQDLAKDLAILAQEIHDVAGDTEAQSASTDKTGPDTSTHEELRHQIPEAGLNFQKESPAATADESEHIVSNGQRMRANELTLNNTMLNPVSQLSLAIRENTEQLTEKIKILFHNKMDVLEEIEANINKADDSPPLKTSNKEIASILRELQRVQKQLEVINTVIDPRGNPDLSRTLASAGVRGSRAASHRRMFGSTDPETPPM
ncbi:centrosomal protein of 170 kDa protein B isoform X1 [Carassius gibelio]|uniref:centrosomal protein of 170 kDa protein B isoform X1 n=1 Tax=Carassius gibelio TaxID=101364 RepID=UPI002277E625|nr:centrosomal protein of 170 kDa protein B isoform X1 [Carassius gibelio]XP_052386569.1 centrosomal protein of 170 kDa protein B isoform X1 [Carassius gibelio]XP_052386570.1 centrosomal protein of 170 kDa protein B isoform X1 [Carassius gibelio]